MYVYIRKKIQNTCQAKTAWSKQGGSPMLQISNEDISNNHSKIEFRLDQYVIIWEAYSKEEPLAGEMLKAVIKQYGSKKAQHITKRFIIAPEPFSLIYEKMQPNSTQLSDKEKYVVVIESYEAELTQMKKMTKVVIDKMSTNSY